MRYQRGRLARALGFPPPQPAAGGLAKSLGQTRNVLNRGVSRPSKCFQPDQDSTVASGSTVVLKRGAAQTTALLDFSCSGQASAQHRARGSPVVVRNNAK